MGILLLVGVVWYGRQRFVAQRDARTEGAELTPANLMGKSVDDLLPVPKSRSVDAASAVAGQSERGYGESLLTGYATDQSMADAVAEADIYVAYGRHQHALDTLEAASAAEPSSALGLMKMLEIYVSLDRIDEARELLGLIEATGDEGALVASQSKLDTHQAQLAGDQAAHDLAQGSQSENEEVLDLSLDLDFQQASRSVPEAEESDASGVLDPEDPGETALDLARAYLDMGDQTGAAELLQSVISMGDAAQCEQARALLDSLD
ncbi:MAG: tetratricopeptide repeat protein [Halieaceae bacterium]|nr:tetratricopeptide repeat protein [Halieaceae bacterium]